MRPTIVCISFLSLSIPVWLLLPDQIRPFRKVWGRFSPLITSIIIQILILNYDLRGLVKWLNVPKLYSPYLGAVLWLFDIVAPLLVLQLIEVTFVPFFRPRNNSMNLWWWVQWLIWVFDYLLNLFRTYVIPSAFHSLEGLRWFNLALKFTAGVVFRNILFPIFIEEILSSVLRRSWNKVLNKLGVFCSSFINYLPLEISWASC